MRDWKDRLGIFASAACAVHCAATPFLVAALPTLKLTEWMADPRFHQIAAVICCSLVAIAIVPTALRFRDLRLFSFASSGLGLILAAAFLVPDTCCSSSNCSIEGSGILASSHAGSDHTHDGNSHDDHSHHDHGDDHHAADHGHGHHGEVHGHAAHGHAAAVQYAHPADQYLPYLWSCFFYILICNLLGAIPFLGSATGSISVTAVLAVFAFFATIIFGFQAMGPAGFFTNMMPDTGVGGPFGSALSGGVFLIEIFGFFIKHGVLAVRLFANIMGGHTVLGVILGFIAIGAEKGFLWYPITLGSIGMQVFIGCLELFVAFLQAYVFCFLATIFIAGAVHKH